MPKGKIPAPKMVKGKAAQKSGTRSAAKGPSLVVSSASRPGAKSVFHKVKAPSGIRKDAQVNVPPAKGAPQATSNKPRPIKNLSTSPRGKAPAPGAAQGKAANLSASAPAAKQGTQCIIHPASKPNFAGKRPLLAGSAQKAASARPGRK
ncbi:hypothetical protein H0H92_006973 [Tricholoma furcatifolium]|nr:hypothetical protein H0H92_006973 [Tricholoma furcatifolium]